jgi:hypothetical protein
VQPIKPHRGRPELEIQNSLRAALARAGWSIVEKTHGNAYQAGWPDLYCYHPVHKIHRWIEVKAPRGKLTPAQRERFRRWDQGGLGVYVMVNTNLALLYKEPNWKEWL